MRGNDHGKKVDELNMRDHGSVEHETSFDSISSGEDVMVFCVKKISKELY